MRLYQIDPIQDPRWEDFVATHSKASVFHTVSWLRALQQTYGYEPVAFTTTSPASELENGIVFCRVKSWLTGRRLVSLPFSDHCEPLCDSAQDLNFIIRYLQTSLGHQQWKYIEIRPVEVNFEQAGEGIDFARTASHSLHTLDLGAELTDLFGSLDKDSVQRRIHRARRAGLIEKSGRSEDLLNDFYTLFVLTRGRHRLPPNPVSWFRNLIDCEGDDLEIRVAYGHGIPMAAILTLRFRETLCYKYGCSDVRFNRFGAMPWLLWNALSASKSTGAKVFDLGRTEDGDAGLLRFKNNWAPGPRTLSYWRFPETYPSFDSAKGWKLSLAKRAFSHMPNGLLTITGRLLYRHIG